MEISIADLKIIYSRLNVEYDLWYGESDADPYIDLTIQKIQSKGLLYKSEGAQVVDVALPTETHKIPPIIIIKSNGAVNYATTDVATLYQRRQNYDPDKIWYVVDNRQSLHFTQVFRCAKLADIVSEKTEMEHCSFGTVNGKDGKPFKTRDGGVMRLQDMLDMVIQEAYRIMKDSEYVTDDKNRREVAEKIGIAAIKFGDMINYRSKDYIFEPNKFVSFEGKTGPYLLYSLSRINSILKKAAIPEYAVIRIRNIYDWPDRELILEIISNSRAFAIAAQEKAPNNLCEKVYRIATAFSKLYNECRIIDEPNTLKRETMLALCILTKRIIELHLEVLAIDTVENM